MQTAEELVKKLAEESDIRNHPLAFNVLLRQILQGEIERIKDHRFSPLTKSIIDGYCGLFHAAYSAAIYPPHDKKSKDDEKIKRVSYQEVMNFFSALAEQYPNESYVITGLARAKEMLPLRRINWSQRQGEIYKSAELYHQAIQAEPKNTIAMYFLSVLIRKASVVLAPYNLFPDKYQDSAALCRRILEIEFNALAMCDLARMIENVCILAKDSDFKESTKPNNNHIDQAVYLYGQILKKEAKNVLVLNYLNNLTQEQLCYQRNDYVVLNRYIWLIGSNVKSAMCFHGMPIHINILVGVILREIIHKSTYKSHALNNLAVMIFAKVVTPIKDDFEGAPFPANFRIAAELLFNKAIASDQNNQTAIANLAMLEIIANDWEKSNRLKLVADVGETFYQRHTPRIAMNPNTFLKSVAKKNEVQSKVVVKSTPTSQGKPNIKRH